MRIQGGTAGTAVYNGLSLGTGNGLRVGDFGTIGGGEIYATSTVTCGALSTTNMFRTNGWLTSHDGVGRFYFGSSGRSYYKSWDNFHEFRGTNDNPNTGHIYAGTIELVTTRYFGSTNAYYIYGPNSVEANQTWSGINVSIISGGAAWFKSWVIISSDERIKTNIKDIDDDSALQKILSIQPKTYEYIDKISKGNNTVYGFIAQQIKEVIPEAVQLTEEVIPNIYKSANLTSNTITLNDDISNKVNVDDEICILTENEKKNYKVLSVDENKITIDDNLEGDKCFVYGTKVNDFHALDKTYIYTLNVCATQELYKLIQQQNLIIQDLQTRLSILENK